MNVQCGILGESLQTKRLRLAAYWCTGVQVDKITS
jgi:hypothetical protein